MDIFTTVVVAFVLFLAALALVGIGWLITGKARVKFGACGRNPDKKKDEECGNKTKCGLCDKDKDDL